jgi:hypothetical protein
MAIVNLVATKRGPDAVIGQGLSGSVKCLQGHVSVGAADSATSTYDFGNIPSDARILGISRLHYDDLATSGSPTLDIGLFAVDSNVTSDADALNDGIDAGAANGASVSVIKDKANYGKRAWEHVSGQATDPGGALKVKVSLLDADVNQGGDMYLELFYTLD